jgi:hypothetical protein
MVAGKWKPISMSCALVILVLDHCPPVLISAAWSHSLVAIFQNKQINTLHSTYKGVTKILQGQTILLIMKNKNTIL